MVRRICTPGTIGFAAAVLVTAILVLNCCGSSAPTEPIGRNDERVGKQDTAPLAASTTPEGTVSALYADKIFFDLRNEIPPSVIEHLSPCMTADLKGHFERFNEDVKTWMARNQGAGLKLPVSEGPIFLSNYEGADSYRVGKATVRGNLAQVPVSLSITDPAGTFEWVDVVLLRRVGDVWLLDDIKFGPDEGDGYTLRDRVALVE